MSHHDEHYAPVGGRIATRPFLLLTAFFGLTLAVVDPFDDAGVREVTRLVGASEVRVHVAARAALTDATVANPVAVRVHDAGIPRLPGGVEATLYFCALEAVQNATKHSGGTRIDLWLGADDGGVSIRVEDDGSGIPSVSTEGSGLTNLRERVAAIGGRLEVGERPGGGTTVAVHVPESTSTPAPSRAIARLAPTSSNSAWRHDRRCRNTRAKARMMSAKRAGRCRAASRSADTPSTTGFPRRSTRARPRRPLRAQNTASRRG